MSSIKEDSAAKQFEEYKGVACKNMSCAFKKFTSLPEEMTTFKHDFILSKATSNVRILGLGFATFLVSLLSVKCKKFV